MIADWGKYAPYFTKGEFDCRETGENDMQPEFMDALLALRIEYGRPMVVTSGYRSITHSRERNKLTPGQHTHGRAVDISSDFYTARAIIELACKHGFTFGVSQRNGLPRFIHLDLRPGKPGLYSY